MATDPDAIWKPNYDGPPPAVPQPVTFGGPHSGESERRPSSATESDPAASTQGSGRSSRWWIAGGIALGVALTAVVITTGQGSDEADSVSGDPSELATPPFQAMEGAELAVTADLPSPLDVVGLSGEPFAGAEPRRLPERVDELWRFRLDDGDPSTGRPVGITAVVEAIDSRFVAAISGQSAPGVKRSTLSLLDAGNGGALWTAELGLWPESFRIIGASGSTLLIESPIAERRVVGYDLSTGAESWTIAETANRIDVVGLSSHFEVLAGTDVLARRPNVETNPTLLFDPETGNELGELPGEIIGTDHLGTYFVAVDDGVLVVDLSDGVGAFKVVSLPDTQPGDQRSVVDGNVVVVREGSLLAVADAATEYTVLTEGASDVDASPDDADLVRLPRSIVSAGPMIGPTMLVSGSGMITGAELIGDEIRPAWRRAGAAGRMVQTERGTVILVSRLGGSSQTLVDGRTGRTISLLTMTPGVLDNLTFAGNGVLMRRTSGGGKRLAAVDLDGQEIWSLPGTEPVSLGDGIVVRVEVTTDEASVVAYGA